MRKTISIFGLLIALSLIYAGCSSDDAEDVLSKIEKEEEEEEEFAVSMLTANVDGQSVIFNASNIKATVLGQNNGGFILEISAVNLTSDSTGSLLSLGIVGLDFPKLKPGDTFTNDNFTDGISSAFYGDNRSIATNFFLGPFVCTITNIDHEKHIVSGTFSFDTCPLDEEEEIVQVRNGVFTNIKYGSNGSENTDIFGSIMVETGDNNLLVRGGKIFSGSTGEKQYTINIDFTVIVKKNNGNTLDTRSMGIVLSGTNLESLVANSQFQGNNATFFYSEITDGSAVVVAISTLNPESETICKITSIDHDLRLVSGIFSFKDTNVSNLVAEVTFSNLEY